MIRTLLLPLGLVMTGSSACAFDVNDCIINGMKGVSSDAAARQVRYACDQKKTELKRQNDAALIKDFGETVDSDILVSNKLLNAEGSGFFSTKYTNRSTEKSVTFVRLEVMPALGGPGTECDVKKSQTYNYTVMMKPGASLNFIFPSSASVNCVDAYLIKARPPRWTDVGIFSSVKPIENNPFANLE